MNRWFPVLMAGLVCAVSTRANGLLIPSDASVPPLALVSHEVKVKLVEQVADTEVTQVFRNHTDRPLEATFVFPVPAGASVNRFSMWVEGKEVKGEMVEADKARQIYTDIVRRTQDPGLLEYIGQNLLRVRVFPVPARGDQKLALRFTAVCNGEGGLVEYVYPLKTAEKAAKTLETFSFEATLESKAKVQNVYSPTHPVTVKPAGDHRTLAHFEAKQATLDRDLKLYFSLGNKDVGLTALTHRPDPKKDGHFLMLISPRAELSKSRHVARDIVFVLDQSGSMAGTKMEQAKKALDFCLSSLNPRDRFAVMAFATTVQKQADALETADNGHLTAARQWVKELAPTGGTAIDHALGEALALRPTKNGRPFTVVFFTDGQPTIGETDPERIVKNVESHNSTETRIFTFGVGDDVNAMLLDRLADLTRSASAYVRPEEDIEAKVSSLYGKISHPVLTDLKLSASAGVTLVETYPKQLPDLFHGGQLVVLGRYTGRGHAAVTLSGKVDGKTNETVYEVDFPAKTSEDRAFVENLWVRRKVAYLLDQIRVNGQERELIDEVTVLAKKHGITTPYTSYLVVPDAVASNAPRVPRPTDATPADAVDRVGYYKNHGYQITPPAGVPAPSGGSPYGRYNYAPVYVSPTLHWAVPGAVTPVAAPSVPSAETATAPTPTLVPVTAPLPQSGKEGVDLALQLKSLRDDNRLGDCTSCLAAGRTCRDIGGAWVDEGYRPEMKTVVVKAQSEAYFKLLAAQPQLKDVFRLGNRLVWVTPSGTALVIDPTQGSDKLTDAEVESLFAAPKK